MVYKVSDDNRCCGGRRMDASGIAGVKKYKRTKGNLEVIVRGNGGKVR